MSFITKTVKHEKQKVVSLSNNSNGYGWKISKNDAVLHLGTMRKAIIIRRKVISDNAYFISVGSFFPLPTETYDIRFNNIEDAVDYSNELVNSWLQETYKELGL